MNGQTSLLKGTVRRRRMIALGWTAAIAGCVLYWCASAWAELTGPQPVDKQITFAVTTYLNRQHLLRHPLDDEISARWLKNFIKMLDPMKLYFTQADIDEFKTFEYQLDDLAKKRDVSFAYHAFKDRFLVRIDERVALVDELLKMDHDFTANEELITDPEKLDYAKNDADIRDVWRRRVKYDLLQLKSEKIEGQAAIDKLTRRYHSFAKRMRQTDSDELLEMYLTALTTSYDPHTTYMSQGSLDNFEISMKLKLEGIGAALQMNDGYTVVSKVIPGGAADKDGRLKPEDRVVGVGQGENGEIVDVQDMKLNDVVKLIRGDRGTIVRLAVIPVGQTDKQVYNITRAEIELTDSEAKSEIKQAGLKPDGTPFKVGVVVLPSFYMDMAGARRNQEDFKSTTRDVRRLLVEFNKAGVDAVVLDLRMNGGGSLTEAINLTGLFIDQGPVVQVKDAAGDVQPYVDPDPGMAWSGPLVVVTNKLSASASEIFAGAIQDYHRGLVVGDKSTHGKGTVQSLLELGQQLFHVPNAPKLGALKITMQQFYRPNGDSTQNRGVESDVELPALTSNLDVGESSLDYALKFDQVPPSSFVELKWVQPWIVDRLRQLSGTRVAQSADFQKEQQRIAHYKEQKERKRISLNEATFFAERADLNAEKEEEKQFEDLANSNTNGIKDDYYLKEVLSLTVDYLGLLQSPQAAAIGKR